MRDDVKVVPVPAKQAMSEEAYFEMLEKSIDKYEYWNGVAVAMSGVQPNHVAIEANILGELFQQLRGRDCRPLGCNQAVKLSGSKGYVFPDVTVVCGKPEHMIRQGIGCLLNPAVVVEVLSPSTASATNWTSFWPIRVSGPYASMSSFPVTVARSKSIPARLPMKSGERGYLKNPPPW